MEQELPTTATAEMMDVLGLAKKALAKQDETADRRSREDPWALAEGRQPKWPKPQSKGLSGKGASSWDSWKPHQQEWFNLDAEDKTVDAATQDLLTVLVRMAIRHEEELAKLRIDTTMIFYLDTNSGGILLQVRQVAEHWSNEFEKGRVKSPLKVILLLSIFQEVSSRMTALLQDDAQMAKAKEWQWIQDGATGLDPLWTYFQWNPVEKKQEQSALSPIKNSEVCRHLDFLAQHLAHENVLTKFKATCRMSSTDRYASAVLPFFCSLSLRGDVAARCHQAIRSLVNCSALKTIGMRIKPARAKDSHWLRSWSEPTWPSPTHNGKLVPSHGPGRARRRQRRPTTAARMLQSVPRRTWMRDSLSPHALGSVPPAAGCATSKSSQRLLHKCGGPGSRLAHTAGHSDGGLRWPCRCCSCPDQACW